MSTLFVQNNQLVDEWLATRRRLGQDRRDEIWEGVYHVVPPRHSRNGNVAMQVAFALHGPSSAAGLTAAGPLNLGEPQDYRVPDLGYLREVTLQAFCPTAALVIEVPSPGDETHLKHDFYAARGVEELWVVDPLRASLQIRQRDGASWDETGRSDLLGLSAESVRDEIRWPRG